DDQQLVILTQVMTKLGGAKVRPWNDPRDTPNRPIGTALGVLAFWNRFFPARGGHWGGWVLETYPQIDEISFTDAARTRAEAKVTIGYAGCTVVLEKRGGDWKALALKDEWIT